jgi:hypothetical protein
MSHMLEPKRRLRGVITRTAPKCGRWSAHSDEVGDFDIEIGEVGASRTVQHVMLPHLIVGALVEFDYQKDSDGDLWITDVEVIGVGMPKPKLRKRPMRAESATR